MSQAEGPSARVNYDPGTEWKTWPELTLRLEPLPLEVKLSHLHAVFDPHEGSVAFMEILHPRGVKSPGVGRIRFSPPPMRPFWVKGKYDVWVDNQLFQISMTVEKPRRRQNETVRSPSNPRRWFPACIRLQPQVLQFGVMMQEITMGLRRTIEQGNIHTENGQLQLVIDVFRKQVILFFFNEQQSNGEIAQLQKAYKLRIDFSHLKKLFHVALADGRWGLVIPLDFPPAYFWKRHDIEKTFSEGRLAWSAEDLWHRATSITSNEEELFLKPLTLENHSDESGFIDIGRWTAINIIMDKAQDSSVILDALRDFNITITKVDHFEVVPVQRPKIWQILSSRPSSRMTSDLEALTMLSENAPSNGMSFGLRYQLEMCISRNILIDQTIGPEFVTKLLSLGEERARLVLEYFADRGKKVYDPMSIFEDEDAYLWYPHATIPYYCAMIRKVLVTPTTIHFTAPSVESSNRILRKYNSLHDRFLRVQFTGEFLEGRIYSQADSTKDDDLFKRVYRVLDQGIRIGDRHYEFLAFGNSQIRECGAYFFCPTSHTSCEDIRKWMGDFKHIRVVAKYAARLGQCFSTTREIRGIRVPNIQLIPEIERNGYCFSDGVGRVSKFLAEIVVREMGVSHDYENVPSAFQFRMGGCKGVLAVWPEAKGMEVHIRKSQQKFKSVFNGLEVIRCARFSVATLNRQTITVLGSLGVPTSAFETLLDAQLKSYQEAMVDSPSASSLLRKFVDENQMTLTIAEMVRSGLMDSQEPFVMTLLNLWRIWSLKLLKEKARIIVDEGAFVLGCVDETGTLRGHQIGTEGSSEQDTNQLPQIFLQITDTADSNKTKIVTGLCLVGRNPSLHPGDIRMVQAVDTPTLHHLRDVVVFPSKGDRDVPSMLSGGDLDGDDFFVIWDKTLMPPEWNYPPMQHQAPAPPELDRDVDAGDLRIFFVRYMKNDILPRIALAHLAQADFHHDGVKNPACLQLAQLHSKAVDYVKTGEPAEMDKSLRPRRWPHFMEKRVAREQIYESRKALGIIYNKVQSVRFNPIYTNQFDERVLNQCPRDLEMLKKARQIKTQYDTAIRRLMGQREIATEFEIWTAFPLSKPRVGSGYKLQEDLGRESAILKQRFREICSEAAGGNTFSHLEPFVAAMYKVTHEEVKIALYERRHPTNIAGRIFQSHDKDARSMPLISFPWIFHSVLCRMVSGLSSAKDGPINIDFNQLQKRPLTERIAEPSTSDEPDVTRLNDGRIIHRGEVLNLFETNGDGYDEDDTVNSSPEPINFLDQSQIPGQSEKKEESPVSGQEVLSDGPSIKSEKANGVVQVVPLMGERLESIGNLRLDAEQPQNAPGGKTESEEGGEGEEVEFLLDEDTAMDQLCRFGDA